MVKQTECNWRIFTDEDLKERTAKARAEYREKYGPSKSLSNFHKFRCRLRGILTRRWQDIRYFPMNIRSFCLRGKRGYGYDAYDFDSYLAEIIVGGLKDLARIGHQKTRIGHPGNISDEKWTEILTEIIEGFELYIQDEFYVDENNNMRGSYEHPKYLRAMKLFSKWFSSFWS